MQLRKGTLPLVGIVVLALITFAVVFAFFSGLSRSVEVVVARRGLAAGTRLTAEDVALKHLHASAVLDGALTTPADAVGQVLSAPRLPGDQITRSLVGDRAISGIAATLPAGWRAIAVHVDQATGLAGILRPGDQVEAIAVVDREALPMASTKDEGDTLARIVLHDLQVLLVPQSFRYEEAPVDSSGAFALAPARTTATAQSASVIVLGAPVAPTVLSIVSSAPSAGLPAEPAGAATLGTSQPVTATLTASPVELLALLDAKGKIHLALEPVERELVPTGGVSLNGLLPALVPAKEPER